MGIYWEEDQKKEPFQAPENVVDIAYVLSGKTLPIDHAYELSVAILDALPWFEDEPDAGVHLIHVAASSNGWERPEDSESAVLHLSRRTRMSLRIPKSRQDDAMTLTGKTLNVGADPILVGKSSVKSLSVLPTLFARYVACDADQDEAEFMDVIFNEFNDMGIKARKILCGMSHRLNTPQGQIDTRSVMVADLEPEQSILLQEKGLGAHRKMGCGLFLPHKGIKPVGDMADKQHFSGS